ncbi:MAG TPA: divalent cation tolerance protein CutA [Chitinophagales bacterium]|nr:divalent cation tolerance protein CutA [Chitinophagales bacterium]HRK26452.1 divalent cation tolerance protein CutA [Chitinophagales bacterium]
MIALHIEISRHNDAQAIAELLLKEKLISDVSLFANVPSLRLTKGNIANTTETVLVATTEQNLYLSIEKRLRDFCKGKPMPFIYTMPT